jgi:flagellar basal-body rod protein FlgB
VFNNLAILKTAQALATHASHAQGVHARNIAHSDTPGFQARSIRPFAEVWAEARSQGILPPRADLERPDPSPVTRSPDGNTVSLEHEMMRAAQARHNHDMALGVYSMSRDILRASIGK